MKYILFTSEYLSQVSLPTQFINIKSGTYTEDFEMVNNQQFPFLSPSIPNLNEIDSLDDLIHLHKENELVEGDLILLVDFGSNTYSQFVYTTSTVKPPSIQIRDFDGFKPISSVGPQYLYETESFSIYANGVQVVRFSYDGSGVSTQVDIEVFDTKLYSWVSTYVTNFISILSEV